MDIATLAQSLTTFLTPFLPHLLQMGKKAGEKAAEEAEEKLGAEAWEQAQTLWGKLRGHEDVEKAAQDAAGMPDDPDATAALRLQLKKILKQNEALANELAQHLQEAQDVGATVTASGERSVAIGGSASGSTIMTGDGNVVGDQSSSEVEK